jgi:hypothetical protein
MSAKDYGCCVCVCCRDFVWLVRYDGYAKRFTYKELGF